MKRKMTLTAVMLIALPMTASAAPQNGDYICYNLSGNNDTSALTIQGRRYLLTMPDGTIAKGRLKPDQGQFAITSGPLLTQFALDGFEGIEDSDTPSAFRSLSLENRGEPLITCNRVDG